MKFMYYLRNIYYIASLKYSIIVCFEISIMYWRTKITDLNLYLD